jgi:hypothetical protein
VIKKQYLQVEKIVEEEEIDVSIVFVGDIMMMNKVNCVIVFIFIVIKGIPSWMPPYVAESI